MAKQTPTFNFFKQKRIDVFSVIIVFLFTLIFVSCNESQKPPVESQATFAVVKYDINVIKKWLDDTTNKAFIFQFYTNEVQRHDSVWQALSYIIDSKGNYRNGFNPDSLRLDTKYNNDTAQFTGKVAVGNNGISASRMRTLILKPDGTPKGEFLIFIPKIHNQHRHVYYRMAVESNNKLTGDDDDTNPCPPIDCFDEIE